LWQRRPQAGAARSQGAEPIVLTSGHLLLTACPDLPEVTFGGGQPGLGMGDLDVRSETAPDHGCDDERGPDRRGRWLHPDGGARV
jgi:hypothetical protein